VETAPRSAQAHYNLGRAIEDTGDLAGAAREYRAAIEAEPENARDARYNLGTILLRQERPVEALAVLEEGARHHPEDAGIHLNRGQALGILGRYSEARSAYELALALRPDYATAHNNLAVVCLVLGDVGAAARHAEAALALGFPVSPDVLAAIRAARPPVDRDPPGR
jgi:tetratricopeptide (TPR) repeat protein